MTTVYLAAGEDTSLLATSVGVTLSTAASTFRPGLNTRTSFQIAAGSATYPPTNFALFPAFTPVSSFWTHFRHWNNFSTSTTSLNQCLMSLIDASGVGRILVLGAASNTKGQLKICSRNAAGTITTLATTAAGAWLITPNSTPMSIDLFVNYATAGQATLYINGVIVADTGPGVNITTDGATSLAQLLLSNVVGPDTNDVFVSEIVVQDTITLAVALQALPPLAAGTTQSFTPNTVANINPTTINDANFVFTASNNVLSEWTLLTTLPTGSWSILAVVQEARVAAGSGGPVHFEWLTRTSDGSDHVTGSVAPAIGNYNNFQQIWNTSPHSGVAWVAGELINAGIESLA